jgi:hypothetical protein
MRKTAATQKQQNKMFKPTPKKRVLFVRRSRPVVLALFGVFSILTANIHTPKVAYAASANTVNFQARLQTASGAIVPDGNYNVEFSIYDASTGGTKLWHEDYLNANSQGLQTVNGYLSANLGSITAFSGINWDQQLWLTMNIGGTVTTGTFPTIGDGEMDPRLTLTAVPAAFSASQLATSNTNGRSTLTLQGSGSGHGNQNFVIQDQGAAGTYNLLTQTQADSSYIQNTTSLKTGDFNISGTGIADVLQAGTALETPSIRPITDSTSALQVQNAAGTVSVLTVDTTNDRIGIGTDTPGSTIDIMSGGSDYTTSALNIENSASGTLMNIRDDGQVTIGTTAASGTSATIGLHDLTGTAPDGGGDSNYFAATKVSTGTNPGALTELSIYITSIDPNPVYDKYRLALYADNGTNQPTTLIAQSAEGTLVASSYNTLPVSASLAANTTYWIAYVANGSTVGSSNFSYRSAGAGSYYSYSYPYAALPSTAASGGSSGAITVVMSGSYSESGTGTVPALTVAASGNVGIGVGSPIYALQVQGTAYASAYLQNGSAVCDISNNCGSLTSSTGVTLQSGTLSAQTGSLDITGAAIAGSLQAASLDRVSSGALTLGGTNATSIVLGNVSSGNYITFTASGGLVATGTAQHAKTISLTAEYAGAVLDASNDTGGANCSTNNNGTMTSAYDGSTTYYKWVSNATAQCYDVIVRVPIPSDFGSWASSTPVAINTYTSNTSTGLINLDVKDTANTGVSGCAYASVTPGSTGAWTSMGGSCNLSTGTYTPGTGVITLRIRLTGGASSDVRVDGITLNYNSKF